MDIGHTLIITVHKVFFLKVFVVRGVCNCETLKNFIPDIRNASLIFFFYLNVLILVIAGYESPRPSPESDWFSDLYYSDMSTRVTFQLT